MSVKTGQSMSVKTGLPLAMAALRGLCAELVRQHKARCPLCGKPTPVDGAGRPMRDDCAGPAAGL